MSVSIRCLLEYLYNEKQKHFRLLVREDESKYFWMLHFSFEYMFLI